MTKKSRAIMKQLGMKIVQEKKAAILRSLVVFPFFGGHFVAIRDTTTKNHKPVGSAHIRARVTLARMCCEWTLVLLFKWLVVVVVCLSETWVIFPGSHANRGT